MIWEELGNLCEFINGDRGKNYPSQSAFVKEGIPFINAGHLLDNKINKSELNYISDDHYKRLNSGKIQIDDILFCLRGSLGKFAVNTDLERGAIASSLVIIRANKKLLDFQYLAHFLKTDICKKYIYSSDNGSSQPNLSASNVKKFKIPLPPLPIQKRIASILDEADRLRQLDAKLLEKYDQLTQSLFLEMFGDPVTNPKGWEKKTLGEFINVKHGYAFKSEFFKLKGAFKLLTPGHFYEKGGYKDLGGKQKFYVGEFPNEYLLKKNDLLIAMTEQAEGLLGSPLFVPSDNIFLHNQRLGLVQYIKEVNPIFIFCLLNQKSIRKLIHFQATGTKVRHTSPTKLKDLEVGIPSLSLQNQFAERVEIIEQQKAKMQEGKKQSEALFQSLLQRAFKGELVAEEVLS